jgi:hypothetical protein
LEEIFPTKEYLDVPYIMPSARDLYPTEEYLEACSNTSKLHTSCLQEIFLTEEYLEVPYISAECKKSLPHRGIPTSSL